jgi:hypothetical protein
MSPDMLDARVTSVLVSGLALAVSGCGEGSANDPAGDEGNLGFHLGDGYGERVLRGLPLAADDLTTLYVESLADESADTFESSDPEVLAVESTEGVSVCATFTLIGDCDRVSTGNAHVQLRTGRPGPATLRALRADGTLLDRITVEVRRFDSFRAEQHLPWRFGPVGSEATFSAVPVDGDGDPVWIGSTASWVSAPEHLVNINSQHRQDASHRVRAIAVTPGEGALVVSGPGGVEASFAIVVE